MEHTISELNFQPTDTPVQRFKCDVAAALAWLGARVARYAFPVRLFHSLLHTGLSRRYPDRSVCATSQQQDQSALRLLPSRDQMHAATRRGAVILDERLLDPRSLLQLIGVGLAIAFVQQIQRHSKVLLRVTHSGLARA